MKFNWFSRSLACCFVHSWDTRKGVCHCCWKLFSYHPSAYQQHTWLPHFLHMVILEAFQHCFPISVGCSVFNVPAAVIVTLEIILFRWYNARSHICLQHSVIQVFKQALCHSASKAKNSSQKQTPSNQTPCWLLHLFELQFYWLYLLWLCL